MHSQVDEVFTERLTPELEAVLCEGFNPMLLAAKDLRHRPIVLTKIGDLDLQAAHAEGCEPMLHLLLTSSSRSTTRL